MGKSLTKRQHEFLSFIEDFIAQHEYSPSFRELADHFGLSSSATVAEHLETLQRKGYLTKDPLEARSLQLVASSAQRSTRFLETQASASTIPLLGSIAAGSPIEAIETQSTIDIPSSMAGPNVFALKVRGDSMIDDGILDGDFVIVQQTDRPRDGDIVVALIDQTNVTLKRFYKEANRIRLQPANRSYQPLYSRDATIQGKVRGVIRQFV